MSTDLYTRMMMRAGIPCEPLMREIDEHWASLREACEKYWQFA